eukprot:7602252-Alexandrium_andersonii.AAC.1
MCCYVYGTHFGTNAVLERHTCNVVLANTGHRSHSKHLQGVPNRCCCRCCRCCPLAWGVVPPPPDPGGAEEPPPPLAGAGGV